MCKYVYMCAYVCVCMCVSVHVETNSLYGDHGWHGPWNTGQDTLNSEMHLPVSWVLRVKVYLPLPCSKEDYLNGLKITD